MNPNDPLFENSYRSALTCSLWTALGPLHHRDLGKVRSTDRKERQAHRPSPTASKAGQFNGPERRHVKRNGTIYFPTLTAACACARRTRARASTSRAIYMINGGKLTRSSTTSESELPRPVARRKNPIPHGSRDKYVRRYRVLPTYTVTDSRMVIDISGDPTPGITRRSEGRRQRNVWESAQRVVDQIASRASIWARFLTPGVVANV